jgi:hypothetical protein
LLYLVSNAFEEEYYPLRWGWPGAPLLGMEKFIRADKDNRDLHQVVSLNFQYNQPNHGIQSDVAYADGQDGQPDLWSFMVMPYYNFSTCLSQEIQPQFHYKNP